MPPIVPFSLVLLIGSIFLLRWHRRQWEEAQAGPLHEENFDFARRQYRRRVQGSGLLAGAAVAMLLSPLVKSPLMTVFFWGGVALVILWTGLLAVADMVSIRWHFRRLAREHLAEHAALRAELRREQQRGANGKSPDEPEEPDDSQASTQ